MIRRPTWVVSVRLSFEVWAIDVVQNMLDFIENRLEAEEIENVELKLVPRDDPQLPAGGVDAILMVDTLHYVKDRVAYDFLPEQYFVVYAAK